MSKYNTWALFFSKFLYNPKFNFLFKWLIIENKKKQEQIIQVLINLIKQQNQIQYHTHLKWIYLSCIHAGPSHLFVFLSTTEWWIWHMSLVYCSNTTKTITDLCLSLKHYINTIEFSSFFSMIWTKIGMQRKKKIIYHKCWQWKNLFVVCPIVSLLQM